MKAVFIIVFAISCLPVLTSDSIPSKTNYKTKLFTIDGGVHKGFLSYLDNTNRFSYTEISEINLKRRGIAGKGILYGSLAGGIIGAQKDFYHCREKRKI